MSSTEPDETPSVPVPPAAPEAPAAPEPPAAPAYGAAPVAAAPAAPAPAAAPAAVPYGAAYAAPGPIEPRALSITAMVCGIVGVVLSFFWLGFLPAAAAVVFGHIAQRRERAAKPFWLTGIITGYAGIAISLLWGLVALVPILFALFLIPAAITYS